MHGAAEHKHATEAHSSGGSDETNQSHPVPLPLLGLPEYRLAKGVDLACFVRYCLRRVVVFGAKLKSPWRKALYRTVVALNEDDSRNLHTVRPVVNVLLVIRALHNCKIGGPPLAGIEWCWSISQ